MSSCIKHGILAMVMGLITILTMTGLFAWMILCQIVDVEHMDLMAAGTLILGSGAAAVICGKGEGRIGGIVVGETGIVLVLGLMNLLLFEGGLTGFIPCVLLISGTAMAVVLMGGRKTERRRGKEIRKKDALGKLNKKYTK